MKLIGENIHIISKKTRTAIEERDSQFIQELAKRQTDAGMDWVDLNIGPARRSSGEVMKWLISTIQEVTKPNFSFDTTNLIEMTAGLNTISNPQDCIVNSASGDPERLENMVKLAADYNSYLIALTMSNETGIPREADGRLEIAALIVEKAAEMGVDNTKILMDPLVLPVSVDQTQVQEALNSLRVFKEAFDPPILTTIGLSNISNGSPKEIRPIINRVFAVMAMGCGLDSAIADAFDTELIRINKVIETQTPQKDSDNLMLGLYGMMQEFGELEDLSYNKDNPEEEIIYKTARILLNKNIYAHNYLDETLARA
ncbi:MAG: Dihydropteroate synthase DHPS [uncultured bacterium]|nr:MAG: Dihydropteroate synthase DHPS [uncultured bacterium]HBH17983.1 dihydropteroate synthase DHPS [Cyanobacteria bacterium UBA9579]